ncbi:MAG: hypothetical protein LAT68_08470 [Cyclobacteriaceae bacterium]|nr:hypothetical protein [Cyclobacteriaceae bacterium]MCH8516350.1 hypothetical protein [Cyclobacteriaceae bacterium]
MKHIDKNNLEDKAWRNKFEGGELSTSDALWDNISASLDKNELGRLQSENYRYKIIAASLILFISLLAAYAFTLSLSVQSSQQALTEAKKEISAQNELLVAQIEENEELAKALAVSKGTVKSRESQLAELLADNESYKKRLPSATPVINNLGTNSGRLSSTPKASIRESMTIKRDAPQSINTYAWQERPASYQASGIKRLKADQYISGSYAALEKTPSLNTRLRHNFAGVMASVGSFDPQTQTNLNSPDVLPSQMIAASQTDGSTSSARTFSTNVVTRDVEESHSPDVAFSYGVMGGFTLADRLILQTGISRMNMRSRTDMAITTTTRINPMFVISADNDAIINPANVEENTFGLINEFDYWSVPLQLGYVLGSGRLQIIPSFGVAADFLANFNQRSDSGINLNPDGEHAYRSAHLSALGSLSFNYFLTPMLAINVEPAYRHALNPVTDVNNRHSSQPALFNLNLGLRFHLN